MIFLRFLNNILAWHKRIVMTAVSWQHFFVKPELCFENASRSHKEFINSDIVELHCILTIFRQSFPLVQLFWSRKGFKNLEDTLRSLLDERSVLSKKGSIFLENQLSEQAELSTPCVFDCCKYQENSCQDMTIVFKPTWCKKSKNMT